MAKEELSRIRNQKDCSTGGCWENSGEGCQRENRTKTLICDDMCSGDLFVCCANIQYTWCLHEELKTEIWNLYCTCFDYMSYLHIHGFVMPIGFSRFRVWVHCSTFGLSSLISKMSMKLMHPPTMGCPLFFPNKDPLTRRSLGQHQDKTGEAKMLLGNSGQTEVEVDLSCKFLDGGWLGTLNAQNHEKKHLWVVMFCLGNLGHIWPY